MEGRGFSGAERGGMSDAIGQKNVCPVVQKKHTTTYIILQLFFILRAEVGYFITGHAFLSFYQPRLECLAQLFNSVCAPPPPPGRRSCLFRHAAVKMLCYRGHGGADAVGISGELGGPRSKRLYRPPQPL